MPEVTIPSPVGGWNARDSIAAMPPTDAIELINWIPRAGFVETRPGFLVHNSTVNAVKTLACWGGKTAEKLIACYGGSIAEITTAGVTNVLATGLASAYWQSTNISNKLILANGTNDAQVYDGTSLTNLVCSSALNGTQIYGCFTFKGRAWYWKDNDQSIWYCDAGSFQGTMTEFPLGAQVSRGGKLVLMASLTLDGGDGPDDIACFIFSTGECVVYQGDDPSSASSWQLVGRFDIGEPLGVRAFARMGGASIVLTTRGYIDLARAIANASYTQEAATAAKDSNIADKITLAVRQAIQREGKSIHWSAVYYHAQDLFLVAVPCSAGIVFYPGALHALTVSTGSWTLLQHNKSYNFEAMAICNGALYIATASSDANPSVSKYPVLKMAAPADLTSFDEGITTGQVTTSRGPMCKAAQAFTRLQNGARVTVGGVAPFTTFVPTVGVPNEIFCQPIVDYAYSSSPFSIGNPNTSPATINTTTGSDNWGNFDSIVGLWQNCGSSGEVFAPTLCITYGANVKWHETRFQFRVSAGK